MLHTQEHEELIKQFEKIRKSLIFVRGDLDKEPKEMWSRGHIYCHGEVNNAFLAYRHGYAYGKSKWAN